RRAGRGPHPHGERLSALRLRVSAHGEHDPRPQGSHRAAEVEDPGRERGGVAALLMLARLLAPIACAAALGAAAVDPTPGVLAVAGYKGPDRTARLIAGAKKEGELLLYS